jgi:superfamily I DNA and RNA helicase
MEYKPSSSVTENESGGAAELEVWNRLKDAFNTDERGVLYHQYPIIDKTGGRFDRMPDFVVFHEKLGLLILECKGYTIDQVDRIEGDTWYLNGVSQSTATPLEQARQQGFALKKFFMDEPVLVSDQQNVKIPMNPIVVLPNITRNEWETEGFEGPNAPRAIFGDELTPVAFREALEQVRTFGPLSAEEYRAGRAVLSCGQEISPPNTDPPEDPSSRGELHEYVIHRLNELDLKQQKIGMRIPEGPQQIRGIAGSGKTVLLAMKAAQMAIENPDWRIVVTFQTKSLYDTLERHINRFYHRFSNGQQLSESTANIEIIHGWGGYKTGPGIYKQIAEATPRATFRTVNDAKQAFPDSDSLQGAVASEILDASDVPNVYDAVLIDEAQDFPPEFFRMCLEALTNENRLIWAYDEAQTLRTLTAPSPKTIFGVDDENDPRLDLSGTYPNGVQKTHIMRRSYRSPREVLMTAHTLGMGLLRAEGPVQAVTTQEGWQNLGYEIEGDFRKTGSEAVLRRPIKHSPHPLTKRSDTNDLVSAERFESRGQEIRWITERVARDVHQEGLPPSEVMIVPLGASYESLGNNIQQKLQENDVGSNCVWNGDDKEFAREGEVTISNIHRAKGNEAISVYVVGVDTVADKSRYGTTVQRRNEAFVAISRSRGWCTITGSEPHQEASILNELGRVIESVCKDNPEIRFEVPDARNLENELETETEEYIATSLTDF